MVFEHSEVRSVFPERDPLALQASQAPRCHSRGPTLAPAALSPPLILPGAKWWASLYGFAASGGVWAPGLPPCLPCSPGF